MLSFLLCLLTLQGISYLVFWPSTGGFNISFREVDWQFGALCVLIFKNQLAQREVRSNLGSGLARSSTSHLTFPETPSLFLTTLMHLS